MAVVVRIGGGGLGVQLSQYSSAWSLAKSLQTELLIHDVTSKGTKTSFEWSNRLGEVGITGDRYLDRSDIPRILRRPRFLVENPFVPHAIGRVSSWTSLRHQPHFFDLGDRTLLEGVRLGFKYLQGREDEFKALLSLDAGGGAAFGNALEMISKERVIGVHLRLGDYGTSKLHHQLSDRYFVSAIKQLIKSGTYARVMVFSDEENRARQRIQGWNIQAPIEVMPSDPNSPSFDLALMSHCQGLVMSNSTFSWWAGFLTTGQTVVAPGNFFANNLSANEFWVKDCLSPKWLVMNDR